MAGLGILAGLTAWPLTEIALANQALFPSYFIFNLALGLLMGTIIGGYFGSGQGIGAGSTTRFGAGLTQGALIGLFGGIIGFNRSVTSNGAIRFHCDLTIHILKPVVV